MNFLLSAMAALLLFLSPSEAFSAAKPGKPTKSAKPTDETTAPVGPPKTPTAPSQTSNPRARNSRRSDDYWWEKPFGNEAQRVGEGNPNANIPRPPGAVSGSQVPAGKWWDSPYGARTEPASQLPPTWEK